MSAAGHSRRLGHMERRSAAKQDSWLEAVYQVEEEFQAVRALTAFALALAGTEKAPEPVPVRDETPPADPPAQPPRRAGTPAKDKMARPGPTDVLTWEQAMRVPWLDETATAERQTQPERRRPRGPWEGWGFVGPPSYDGVGGGANKGETCDDAKGQI